MVGYLQIEHHEEKSIKEKSPDMIVTKRRVTKLVASVILVVVRSSGDRVKDRGLPCEWPYPLDRSPKYYAAHACWEGIRPTVVDFPYAWAA